MAFDNDNFNMDVNENYDEQFDDEFSRDAEEDSLLSRRSSKAPKFSFGKLDLSSPAAVKSLVASLAVVLCLLMSFVCFFGIRNVKADASANYDKLNAELQGVKQANSEVLAHLAAVEAALDNTQNVISGSTSSKYIQITKQPTSTPTTVGRENALIFEVKANGNNLKFTWQKYDDASMEWINIVFDIDGFNDEMGLRLYDDSSNGLSQLFTRNLAAKAFGTYRCVITDNVGSQVFSDAVQITEKTVE